MRFLVPVSFLLALACAGPKSESDTEPTEYEGDAAGECGDAADNDRNGLFDCDDPGCDGSPTCEESDTDTDTDADSDSDTDTDTDSDSDTDTDADTSVEYVGEVQASWADPRGGEYDCVGAFSLTRTGSQVSGVADCEVDGLGYAIAGDVSGEVVASTWTGTWEIDSGWDSWNVPLTGTISRDTITATFEWETGGTTFAGIFE